MAQEETQEPVDTRTDRQKRLDEHKARAEADAGAAKALKGLYKQALKDPVIQDIMKITEGFIAYHSKLAQDGVGYEEYTNEKGVKQQRTVRFSPEERVSHLDKAAAQQEIIDYIARQTA